MISKLIPPQFQMLALGVAFAVVFAAGWQVNGWRLGKAQAEAAVTALTGKIDAHGRKLDALGDLARKAIGNEDAVLTAIREGSDEMRAYLAAGNTCLLSDDDARILRANAQRRRAATPAR
ncbi:hypothetical protein [Parvibaculum sp.]|uniref:hypothetical protein n=1 Tax=Parvibaculum sp. TaxID=2024848 RepID=UPI00260E7793|nr:hypothetical protein [Parvibaculum sp.]MCW5727264.1 hypothetical protein [Parvibaculum sp.]